MTSAEFEIILETSASILTEDVQRDKKFHAPLAFEDRCREVIEQVAHGSGIKIIPSFHPSAFPDIHINGFGVEVKTVQQDSWTSTGNSVFEGMRDKDVKTIYLLFGKMGGATPSVKWGRYEDCVTHVRISHAPRFNIEMGRAPGESLFERIGISYKDFCVLPVEEKMMHIRKYARSRLKPGERSWWIEDEGGPGLPLEVKLYMNLPKEEKRKLRAEAAILCPQVFSGSREHDKYFDAAFFCLNHRSVLCSQTRDLFSAGSVAGKERGGSYLLRAMRDIEPELLLAAQTLDPALIKAYWGKQVKPKNRIRVWLQMADSYAKKGSTPPSKFLFQKRTP
ncbi:MAG: restriction endonuclease [Candidatus Kapaibacterium sp.]